jgi:hypothetical protein
MERVDIVWWTSDAMTKDTLDAGAMTVVDEERGTYIVSSGADLRLWIAGALYGPDDLVPKTLATSQDRQARHYVTDQLTRRLGTNVAKWPLTVRFFLADINAFIAGPDGTEVTVSA